MRTLYRLAFIFVLSGSGILGNDLCEDCAPTISPAPTDSPAPSPSPSEMPTDTQKPSRSLRPSSSPSEAPTTSHPSDAPSDVPTESPAPSPSPSLTPTLVPSAAPSVSFMPSKSSQPSISFSPSAKPSRQPSQAPSDSPSARPSISASPTGIKQFMISPNNEVAFQGLDHRLSQNGTETFETVALAYLVSSLNSVEADRVGFQTVRVTDQFLKDNSSGRAELHVLFDVAAMVSLDNADDAEPFNYNNFVKSRFDNQAALKEFYAQLVNSSDHFGSNVMVVLSKSQPESQSTETMPSNNNVAIIASLTCVSVLVGGWAAIYWLRRTREIRVLAIEPALSSCEDIEEQYTFTIKPTETYESVSYALDDDRSSVSTPTASYKGPQALYLTSHLTKKDLEIHQRLQHSSSIDTDTQDSEASLMFTRPAFLTAESNIEIPITPMTNYDMSNVSPKSDKGIGLKAWSSPRSQDDDDAADKCLVRTRIPVAPPRQSLSLFGFGQRTKRKKNGGTAKDTEADAGDREPSIERSHSMPSDADLGWTSSDNITFPSLPGSTQKFPKSAWQQDMDDGDDTSKNENVLDSKVIPTSKSF